MNPNHSSTATSKATAASPTDRKAGSTSHRPADSSPEKASGKPSDKAAIQRVDKRTDRASPCKSAPESAPPVEATALLRADHEQVDAMFVAFEAARSPAKKQQLVASICEALTVHAQVEEEIFYPAFKAALKDHALVPEAIVEHASLKALIAELEGSAPDGEMYDARVKVLSEYVKHHVKEEQDEIFPKARASKLDLLQLGNAIAARKAELAAADR